jgi:hypothetical protein
MAPLATSGRPLHEAAKQNISTLDRSARDFCPGLRAYGLSMRARESVNETCRNQISNFSQVQVWPDASFAAPDLSWHTAVTFNLQGFVGSSCVHGAYEQAFFLGRTSKH